MMKKTTGRIVRSLSGFYDVQTGDKVITCRGRGHLRRGELIPLTGDMVEISVEKGKGMVETILPRKNSFIRPAVANIDALVVFAANVNPVTEPFLIDRVAAIAGDKEVPVYLCVNKCDLDPAVDLVQIYTAAGFPVIRASAETGEGVEALRELIRGKLVAFTGNSGVGKSSMINCLCPELALATGEVSDKLGRGRHTTRHVELFDLGDDTFVMDTPGFSSFDTDQMEVLLKENRILPPICPSASSGTAPTEQNPTALCARLWRMAASKRPATTAICGFTTRPARSRSGKSNKNPTC